MHEIVDGTLWVWGKDHIDQNTIDQAAKVARLPFVPRVALMPDAHFGPGVTVGSVIPTLGHIIPSAVGVDIGCGMAAVRTNIMDYQLPDNLSPLLSLIESVVPAGFGRMHSESSGRAEEWLSSHQRYLATDLSTEQAKTAAKQFGTLGSGNHFVEVSVDRSGCVWLVLHSGSRGIGNQLASMHISRAKSLQRNLEARLEDKDLASFVEGTPEFQAYMADLLWAQSYARANRDQMLNAALAQLYDFVGFGADHERVNCHHNYTAQEFHDGQMMWITRKGAINASAGQLGIIPSSMGTNTFIVRGLGNKASFCSSSHGAGRKMSRNKAVEIFTAADLTELMGNRTWNSDHARALIDESPGAYKSIAQVMAAQADLVEPIEELTQVINYKGYNDGGRKRR